MCSSHIHYEIYGQFTCDNGPGPVEWRRAQPPFFLPSGLDGGVNPPPYAHRAPQGAPFLSGRSAMPGLAPAVHAT